MAVDRATTAVDPSYSSPPAVSSGFLHDREINDLPPVDSLADNEMVFAGQLDGIDRLHANVGWWRLV
jgi:hypothetical protein